MKCLDLNSNICNWTIRSQPKDNASQLHITARTLLHGVFPLEIINEEVRLPHVDLTLDFYIHARRLAIEVQGEQHYKFNSLFHNSIVEFNRAKRRDNSKRHWCDINNIVLIEFPYNESVDRWKDKLNGRTTKG